MPSREEIARLARLAAAHRATTGKLPFATEEDARRCVRFACGCVINGESLPPLFITFGLQTLRDGFELAARWADGEDVAADQLASAWESTRGQAGTFSTDMRAEAAAHWAIVFAIESAMHAARRPANPERFKPVANAAEACARYALMAHGGHTAKQALEYQARLLSHIFNTDAPA